MRILHLTTLVLSLLVFACGGKDATAFDPAGREWEFSLSNPPPVMINTNLPNRKPVPAHKFYRIFNAGDVLRVEGDSIFVENEYTVRFTSLPRQYALLSDGEIPDTLSGFRLTQGIGTTLNAALFKGDSLMGEWLFEEKKTRFKEIAFGELDGQTFRYAFPGQDTMQVYFGISVYRSGRNEGEKFEYFVDENLNFREERSYLDDDRFSFWGRRMSNMRTASVYYMFSREGFNSKRYTYGRNEDGTVIATYFEVENGRYERVDMPLVLLPPHKAGATEADFADRINAGRVLTDNTYPAIDSADVSYAYQDNYKGIEYDELSELEFSAEPDGEFIVVVRDRLLWNRKWTLSPDGHYLITMDKNGDPSAHYPILAYTDEYIDLRMSFPVKTREPRGVALESYARIDTYIRVLRRADATSR